MSDLLNEDLVGTVLGAVVILFLIMLAWNVGPLRVLGEIAGHAAMTFAFVVFAVGTVVFFAETEIGRLLGGISTAVVLILASPFILLAGGFAWAFVARWRRKDKQSDSDAF